VEALRSRRTPETRALQWVLQGVLPVLSARGESLAAAFPLLNCEGSFDCVIVHSVNDRFAPDDSL
jgi:hypothetical protein